MTSTTDLEEAAVTTNAPEPPESTGAPGAPVTGGGLLEVAALAAGDGPAWRERRREEAVQWVVEHGFPTPKPEEWRYTRLKPVLAVPFVRPTADHDQAVLSGTLDRLGGGGGPRLVLVNGRMAPELSRLDGLPDGVLLTNLASVLTRGGGGFPGRWSQRPGPYRHAFAALNSALAEDGAYLELSPGATVDEPLEIVHLSWADGTPSVASPRSFVVAGAGSHATVVETFAGVAGQRYLTNALTQVDLADGAHLAHYRVQDESTDAFHLSSLDVRQARDSRFTSEQVSFGAAVARAEIDVRLEGEGAGVELGGLYLPDGDQQHDNPVLVEHAAKRCTSRQLFKGIAGGHGHGVFSGTIVVRPGADGTDAGQINKNLLLSDRAEADTRPRLEIFADDVLCSHGATVGRLDEDAVFYVRTRGVPEEGARGLLTFGFAHEMVERWKPAGLRARVEAQLAARLGAGDVSGGPGDDPATTGGHPEEAAP